MNSHLVQNRLKELHAEYFGQSESNFTLEEMKKEGKVVVEVQLSQSAILLKQLDNKWRLHCFQTGTCADYAMIQQDTGGYSLHIFELKKTVDREEWKEHIQRQFTGAYLRAEMIGGFLHTVPFTNVNVYTAYQKDKINRNDNKETIATRADISNKAARDDIIRTWNSKQIVLKSLGSEVICNNHHIRLDENGNGKIVIK
jgi:hypothetical protein